MDTERRAIEANGLREILDAVKKLDEKVSTINSVLVGSVSEDKPGLMERMRKVEDWVNNEKKFIYAISFIVVADLIAKVWALVTK